MKARREVARMGTSREVAHMAASRDLIRSRHQQVVAGRRQPPEPHNLAHKMRREPQTFRQICKLMGGSNLVIEFTPLVVAAPISESQVENFVGGTKLRPSVARQINQ
jgi:hypothetical protein